ncbi:MAG TPA: lysophospholipase [Candidatus Sulfotelmatobacter sp.]|nr:lysophospholipase [Candidatus Sulfotelmatobacter sp.]
MEPTRGVLERPDGARLGTVTWRPEGGEASADLILVHGFGEHGGRYGPLVTHLLGHGIAVHAFDLRGHGVSTGRRGHVDRWADYRSDLAAFVDRVAGPGSSGATGRTFVYGHSLGGAIILEYGLRLQPPVAGIVASAPALVPHGVRSPILEGLGRVLSPVWPTFGVHLPLEHAALSRRPETAAGYDHDPLVHGETTARAAIESLGALRWTREHAREWRLPLLLLHGDADRIVSIDGTRAFAADAKAGGAPDVTLIEYPGGFHEPHNDVQAEQVFGDVEAWLARH